MTKLTTLFVTGPLTLAALLAGCQDTPAAPAAQDVEARAGHEAQAPRAQLPSSALSNRSLAALRRSTARYHRVEAALADGFLAPPPGDCVAATPGGMGFHYVHPGHMDLAIDPSRPEALLYEPVDNGKLRLVAAEFLVHGNAWDAAHDDPPSFAGQEFDEPTDRDATMPPGPFYTLHVWIWKENPSGMFAPFNPRVTCD